MAGIDDPRLAAARRGALAAIAIGSNIGDRSAHLQYARHRLADMLTGLRCSSHYETTPVGSEAPQALYLNAVVAGVTRLSPRALLEGLLAIERDRGRKRPFVNAPRTLDLDLILYEDLVLEEPGLVVPHPRFRERRFVLDPLAEVVPDARDPITGLTVRALRVACLRASSGI